MNTRTPHDYIDIVYRRWKWILVPVVLSLAAAAVLAQLLPKAYLSSSMILVDPQKVPENYVRTTVTSSIEDRLSAIRQQLMSRSMLQHIIDEFKPQQGTEGRQNSEWSIASMRGRITVTTVGRRKVNSFTVSYVGSDPTITMKITDKLATLFVEENKKIRTQLVEGTAGFLDVERERVETKLREQERQISEFKRRHMGALPSQLGANLRTLDRLQLQLQEVTRSIREAEDQRHLLEQMEMPFFPNLTLAESARLINDPRVGQLQLLKRRLAELEAEYTENYPDVLTTKREIGQLERNLRADANLAENPQGLVAPGIAPASTQQPLSIEQELNRLMEQQQSIVKQIALYETFVAETPKRELELVALTRDHQNTKNSYDNLLMKTGNARISENLEKYQKAEQFRIIDRANLPVKPFKPNLQKLLALGFIFGLALGVGIVFLLENLDTSVKDSRELEELSNVPVLGIIPKANALHKGAGFSGWKNLMRPMGSASHQRGVS